MCLCLCCDTHTRATHRAHFYTLSPSVCIMFLALPLFLFAGRAKAEPARQTTTKRRKRKNSASSANSSVGTTTGKKRSPATNFSLSSQVPVSINSTWFASSFPFFLWLDMPVYTQAPHISDGTAVIRFNLFSLATGNKHKKLKSVLQDKEISRELHRSVLPGKNKEKIK